MYLNKSGKLTLYFILFRQMQSLNCTILEILIITLFVSGCKKTDTAGKERSDSIATGNLQVFPKDNPWNTDISNEDTDPNSDNIIAGIGNETHLHPDFGTVWKILRLEFLIILSAKISHLCQSFFSMILKVILGHILFHLMPLLKAAPTDTYLFLIPLILSFTNYSALPEIMTIAGMQDQAQFMI